MSYVISVDFKSNATPKELANLMQDAIDANGVAGEFVFKRNSPIEINARFTRNASDDAEYIRALIPKEFGIIPPNVKEFEDAVLKKATGDQFLAELTVFDCDNALLPLRENVHAGLFQVEGLERINEAITGLDLDDEVDLSIDSWLRGLKVGDSVFWNDPDRAISSGFYSVKRINTDSERVLFNDSLIELNDEPGSHAEVFASELSQLAPELKPYSISMHEEDSGDTPQSYFECLAPSEDNAFFQAEELFPQGEFFEATELPSSEIDRIKLIVSQRNWESVLSSEPTPRQIEDGMKPS